MNATLAMLKRAVRKLGPARARGALKAWSEDGRRLGYSSFQSCALARAYGDRGTLLKEIQQRQAAPGPFVGSVTYAAEILGLTEDQAQRLVDCYDGQVMECDHRTLRDLLKAEARRRRPIRRQPSRGGK